MADEDEWDRLAGSRGAPAETIKPDPFEKPELLLTQKELPPPPPRPVRDGEMVDPELLIDGFVDSAAWQAMLAVGDVLFPGFGSYAKEMHWADEIGLPVWSIDSGLALNLSVGVSERQILPRFTVRPAAEDAWAPYDAERPRPPVLRPYDGALVIDTLDPRRYHRAVSGPLSPSGDAVQQRQARTGVDEETVGVVIVSDMAAAGMRVADADVLWRHALGVVTTTLYDPGRPSSFARQVVRTLRYVVFLDPASGVGLSLFVDAARVPWCPLVFAIDDADVRFLSA